MADEKGMLLSESFVRRVAEAVRRIEAQMRSRSGDLEDRDDVYRAPPEQWVEVTGAGPQGMYTGNWWVHDLDAGTWTVQDQEVYVNAPNGSELAADYWYRGYSSGSFSDGTLVFDVDDASIVISQNALNAAIDQLGGLGGGFIGAKLYYSGGQQTIPSSTSTQLYFNRALFNSGMTFAGPGGFLLPQAGYYLVTLTIQWSGAGLTESASGTLGCWIFQNNWPVAASAIDANSSPSTQPEQNVSVVIQGQLADFVFAYVYQDTGETIYLQDNGGSAYPINAFSCVYLGPLGAGAAIGPNDPITHFAVSSPSAATVGTAIAFTVVAEEILNYTLTSYTGTVTFSSSDTGATLPAPHTLTSGVGTFSATFATAGTQTISAADTTTATVTGASGPVTVAGLAPATHFVITNPSTVTAPIAFLFTVVAETAANGTATGYTGTVSFSSGNSDTYTTLPGPITLTNGVGTFSATLVAVGNTTLTATDETTATITGASGSITVGAFKPPPTAALSGDSLTSGLAIFLPLDDSGTSTTKDLGSAGSATCNSVTSGNWETGYYGSVDFTTNGSSYITSANANFLTASHTVMLLVWIPSGTTPSGYTGVGGANTIGGTGGAYGPFYLWPSSNAFSGNLGVEYNADSHAAIDVNGGQAWPTDHKPHLFGYTADGTNNKVTVWLDGVALAHVSTTVPFAAAGNLQKVCFGCDWFNGSFDADPVNNNIVWAAAWTRVLSQTDLTDLMNSLFRLET